LLRLIIIFLGILSVLPVYGEGNTTEAYVPDEVNAMEF